MKLLKSILILSLIVCACVTAYAQEDDERYIFDGDPAPYNIGVQNKIEIPFTLKILYKNTMSEDGKDVKLTGTIEFENVYRINDISIDYYIFDKEVEIVRVTSLNLVKICPSPATYAFEYSYPLDLANSTSDIFNLFVIAEEIETNHI